MNKYNFIKGCLCLAAAFSCVCISAIMLTLLSSDKPYLFGSIGFVFLIFVFIFGFLGLKNIMHAIIDK